MLLLVSDVRTARTPSGHGHLGCADLSFCALRSRSGKLLIALRRKYQATRDTGPAQRTQYAAFRV